jgi:hypothetical protein
MMQKQRRDEAKQSSLSTSSSSSSLSSSSSSSSNISAAAAAAQSENANNHFNSNFNFNSTTTTTTTTIVLSNNNKTTNQRVKDHDVDDDKNRGLVCNVATTSHWVPPNDRELIMRAKLRTGWSSRSSASSPSPSHLNNIRTNHHHHRAFNNNSDNNNNNDKSLISDNEYIEIEKVLQRAKESQSKETDRINKLYQRYSKLNRPQGNGDTTCLICNCNFGIMGGTPRICAYCVKNVCHTCSIDAFSATKQSTFWLCKICGEYKDLLKKSGAWFIQKMPVPIDTNLSIKPVQLDYAAAAAAPAIQSTTISPTRSITNVQTTTRTTSPPLSMMSNTTLNSEHDLNNNTTITTQSEQLPPQLEQMDDDTNNSTLNLDEQFNQFKPIIDMNLIKEQLASSKNISESSLMASRLPSRNSCDVLLNSSTKISRHEDGSVSHELGSLQFTIEYIPTLMQLKIHLISATQLCAKDSNGLSDPYVKFHLLPGIAKATKLRSRTAYKNLNPLFNEHFTYNGCTLHDMDAKCLRLTVLDEDKIGFDFIGEYRLPLRTLIPNEVNIFNVYLEQKQELGDEADTTFRGKINFALKYSKNTNCLYVKINRCTQLLPMDNGVSSDPFIEISLCPSSKETKKFKSTTKWKTLDPEYLEEFKFTHIDLKSLLTKTIEISVWDKDFGKNDFIGIVQLGQPRTGEELRHFFTMIKNPEIYHEQWHNLHLREEEETAAAAAACLPPLSDENETRKNSQH